MDAKLLEILVCPVTKGPLRYDRERQELVSRSARLLILGNPIANRREPVRVAEEMAMVDVYSRGRLECGFVRGVPYEISAGNHRPTRMMERFWEAVVAAVVAA